MPTFTVCPCPFFRIPDRAWIAWLLAFCARPARSGRKAKHEICDMALADRDAAAVADRRTFAIISHPDAGKTTLTEKLLYFGGAIHLAGEVKARGQNRRARSGWMKSEPQRGISGDRKSVVWGKRVSVR